MISLAGVSLHRGARPVLTGVDLTVYPGWKVGVTGANGAGKSSLLELILGHLQADAGEVAVPARLAVAYVAQETSASQRTALEHVMDGDVELRSLESAIAAAQHRDDGERLGELHARLEAIDGYTARARASRLLHGLGFSNAEHEQPVSSFSGGWRVRLNLARALMCRSELLALDEPTNHLDLDAVIWLEHWLRGYVGTLLLISHDREFIDRVVGHIAHVEHGRVTLYEGDYSTFERRRAEGMARDRAVHERQRREVAHMHAFVERFRYKASKARQAQSRLKALSRMELTVPAHVDSPFRFEFREPLRLPRPLLRLEGLAAGYGESAPVLDGVDLTLAPGDRIGLLGRNGAGKSTLVRVLAGTLAPVVGERTASAGLAVGYFAQHQLEQLDLEASPALHLARLDRDASDHERRGFLGGFGFHGDVALEPVSRLSGGQKARLTLALILYRRPNLLLLDEPTNHLDLEMRLALTLALQAFAGAIVLVSHDRHLLRAVSDDLWLVGERRVEPFEGDLDDYARWLTARRGADRRGPDGPPPVDARSRRQQAADTRRALQPLKAEVTRLESELAELAGSKARLETALADGDLYQAGNAASLEALLIEQGRLVRVLGETEEQWLAACERFELAEIEAGTAS